MSEDTLPDPTPASPPAVARRWPRVLGRTIGLGLLSIALLVGAAAGGLWWALRSEAGSAWVVARLPGIEVTGARGTLVGDFEATRVEVTLAGGTTRILLTGFGWRGLQLQRSDTAGLWARIAMDDLHARRLDLLVTASESPTPLTPPAALDLPLQIDIASLRIDALHAQALGDQPLRDLRARVQLGADHGNTHRIDELSAAWERLQAQGAARIETRAPFALEAQLDLAQVGAAGPAAAASGIDLSAWKATLALAGPLEKPVLRATVRSPATQAHPAQSLDAQAGLRPFADWPLADLQASTRALDLSALSASAPVTSLSGTATVETEALDRPVAARIELSNDAAGRWNEGRLPLRRLSAELVGRPDDRSAFELKRFDAELGTREKSAGHLEGRGQWTAARSTLSATLRALQPSLLDARAPEMMLSGPVSMVASTPPGAASATAEGASSPDKPGSATAAVSGPQLEVQLDLNGTLAQSVGKGQLQTAGKTVQLKLDARPGLATHRRARGTRQRQWRECQPVRDSDPRIGQGWMAAAGARRAGRLRPAAVVAGSRRFALAPRTAPRQRERRFRRVAARGPDRTADHRARQRPAGHRRQRAGGHTARGRSHLAQHRQRSRGRDADVAGRGQQPEGAGAIRHRDRHGPRHGPGDRPLGSLGRDARRADSVGLRTPVASAAARGQRQHAGWRAHRVGQRRRPLAGAHCSG